jgi:hypothetical protein
VQVKEQTGGVVVELFSGGVEFELFIGLDPPETKIAPAGLFEDRVFPEKSRTTTFDNVPAGKVESEETKLGIA